MYIAMNRFKVKHGSENDFEEIWRSRDRHLNEVDGYIEFSLLKGAKEEDHTLYSSHTIWSSYDDFDNWTKSDAFRKAHKGAGKSSVSYLGHPQFEGFEVILQEHV